MRKSHPFKEKKKSSGKQVEAVRSAGGQLVADGSLWGNEMIIRVVTGMWTAIEALMPGVIIDFLLCWLGFITCPPARWPHDIPAWHNILLKLSNLHSALQSERNTTKNEQNYIQKQTCTVHILNYFQGNGLRWRERMVNGQRGILWNDG